MDNAYLEFHKYNATGRPFKPVIFLLLTVFPTFSFKKIEIWFS